MGGGETSPSASPRVYCTCGIDTRTSTPFTIGLVLSHLTAAGSCTRSKFVQTCRQGPDRGSRQHCVRVVELIRVVNQIVVLVEIRCAGLHGNIKKSDACACAWCDSVSIKIYQNMQGNTPIRGSRWVRVDPGSISLVHLS